MEYSIATSSKRISDLIAIVMETYDVLHRESDLTPANAKITRMISNLSQVIRQPYTQEEIRMVTGHTELAALKKGLLDKLSEAEFQMELFDSHYLCNQLYLGVESLFHYKNWRKYESLVGEEIKQLGKLSRPEDASAPIVFVGSGPLPLSAVLLHLRWNVRVCCLDIDPDACEAVRVLMERLDLSDSVQIVQGDGAAFDYASYRHVFIASLVSRKDDVLAQIRRTNTDALVAIRTAEGMRQLMYEAVNEEVMAAAGWQLLGLTSPTEQTVINSTLFYRLDSRCN
ncbi:nicotianamine synthase family protein [Paenibacillus sp. CF384]|uniref:nicotianamine synthase family protein n=1 Tax=Paenibacillus sp. CF384 TaxID=1884382 RepID=UPI00089B2517|nr:nicotianamine synthase family protein [Paenibacillus sp. CF384]SDX04153.1 Nicotianamine synthase protein [Paenibacillus sp. CF384]